MATNCRWVAGIVLAFTRQTLVRSSFVLAGVFVAMPGRPQADPVLADDFGDNLINPSVWTVFHQGSGPVAIETNQRLEIVLPANSANDPTAAIFLAAYRSVCRLSGDFDLQVDYQLPTWPAGSGARMALQAAYVGGVGRLMPGSADGFPESYAATFAVLGGDGFFVPTTDLSGKLRLVRTGSTMAGSFLNSSGTWQHVGSTTVTTEDVEFQLVAWSHDAFFGDKDVKVAFDNFVINQGQLTCPANAGPDQTVDEGATVTLGGSNTGANVGFQWQQLAGPPVTLSTPTSAQTSFTAPMLDSGSQVLTFRLTATGGNTEFSSDTFGDNLINPSVWTVFRRGSGPVAIETNQRLEIVLPANSANDPSSAIFSAAYQSACRLSGDFDLQVDYQLPTWPAGSGARMALQAAYVGGVGRLMPGSADGFPESYAATFAVLGGGGFFVPTTDLSGKLRLVRTGSTMAGSFLNSSGTWQQVGSTTVTTEDVRFQLVAWSHDAFFGDKEVKVAFDNFLINRGQLTCPAQFDDVDVVVRNVNHAPEAAAGADQFVNEGSPVALDGSASFDPDSDPISFSWTQSGGPAVELTGANTATPSFTAPLLPRGTGAAEALAFELTVSDGALSASDTVLIVVEQVNHAPVANAGADQTRNEGAVVTLDGTGSSDPDGDPITYQWTQSGGPPVLLSDATSAMPTFTAPVTGAGGAMLVFELSVSDGFLSSTPADQVIVNVVNVNDPPLCGAARPSLARLWPPNHKMVQAGITGVADPNNDQPQITITGVTQDEPVNGVGDGDSSPDAVIDGDRVLLRAERSGDGNGRVYHISFTATDSESTGGSCSGTVSVAVPHSMKPGASSVDDGPLYDSTLP